MLQRQNLTHSRHGRLRKHGENGRHTAAQSDGMYVTTPNPFSPNGQQIEAAGPIYTNEDGSEAGFNTVEPHSVAHPHTPSIGESC